MNRYKLVLSILSQKSTEIENIDILDREFVEFLSLIFPESTLRKYNKKNNNGNLYKYVPSIPNYPNKLNFTFKNHLIHYIDMVLIILSFLKLNLTISGPVNNSYDAQQIESIKIKLELLKKFNIKIEYKIIKKSYSDKENTVIELINSEPITHIMPINLQSTPKRIFALIYNQGCNNFKINQIKKYLLDNIPDIRIDIDNRKISSVQNENDKQNQNRDNHSQNIGITTLLYSQYFYECINTSKFDENKLEKSLKSLFIKILEKNAIDEDSIQLLLVIAILTKGVFTVSLNKNENIENFLSILKEYFEIKWIFHKNILNIEGCYFENDFIIN